jgi:hypothetical protein
MFLVVPTQQTFRLGVFDLLLLDGTLLISIGLANVSTGRLAVVPAGFFRIERLHTHLKN